MCVGSMASSVVEMVANMQEATSQRVEAETNRDLADRAAADAVDRGNQLSGRTRVQVSQLVAKQRVAYANSGVDPNVGTAANVQADTAAAGELDAITRENNAAREAWGFKQKSAGYSRRADRIAEGQKTETALTAARFLSGAISGGMAGGGSFGGGGGGSRQAELDEAWSSG